MQRQLDLSALQLARLNQDIVLMPIRVSELENKYSGNMHQRVPQDYCCRFFFGLKKRIVVVQTQAPRNRHASLAPQLVHSSVDFGLDTYRILSIFIGNAIGLTISVIA
jgi:hypothetical protein